MEYSVIIPVYNSELSLEELSTRLITTLNSISSSFELIFVDDFSKDNSWEVLNKIKKGHPDKIKIIRFAKNYGQHNAVFCGLKYAKGNYSITIDDDLQQAPEDIIKLVDNIKKQHVDAVYGVGKTEHSLFRKFTSWLWKISTKKIDNGIGKGSSFRILTKELVEKIIQHNRSIIFIDEIIQWYTHHINFITVPHYPRKFGKSNYTNKKLFNFILNLSFNYSTVPLKLVSLVGGFISITTSIMGVFFLIRKLFYNVNVPGFTAIIVTVLFSTSLLLLGIGVLGRYLNTIFTLTLSKPAFHIKEKSL